MLVFFANVSLFLRFILAWLLHFSFAIDYWQISTKCLNEILFNHPEIWKIVFNSNNATSYRYLHSSIDIDKETSYSCSHPLIFWFKNWSLSSSSVFRFCFNQSLKKLLARKWKSGFVNRTFRLVLMSTIVIDIPTPQLLLFSFLQQMS